MAKTKYYINLTAEERDLLMRIVCEARESERTIMRARILLMSEAAQAEKTSIKKLADTLGTTDTEYSGGWVPPIRDRIPANRAMIPMCFQ